MVNQMTHMNKIIIIKAKLYYKRFHLHLLSYPNPLARNLSTLKIPKNTPRRLKHKWCRDLLVVRTS